MSSLRSPRRALLCALLWSALGCAHKPATVGGGGKRLTADGDGKRLTADGKRLTADGKRLATATATVAPRPTPWLSPFLWRVEGPTTTYLLGTMHAPDARVEHRPPALEQALAASSAVVTELTFGFFDILNMTSRMLLSPPATLDGVLPPALVTRVERQLAQHGMAWGQVRAFKPWVLGSILDSFLYDPDGSVLDVSLQKYAERHGKPSEALETIDEQVSVFDGMTDAEQVALLEESLEGMETGRAKRELFELREVYFSGDEVRGQQLLDADEAEESPAARKLGQRLLGERNVRMTARIIAQRADGKTRLYAVGVAHLLGKDGLIERLRRAGLAITRLAAPMQSR